MIEWAAIKFFFNKNARILIGATVACLLCLTLGYCRGRSDANAHCEAARALANTKALETNAVASDKAATAQVKDALRIKAHEEDLTNAISQVPDTAPDAVRVQLGCQRLRAQGTDPATLPAVCRR